MPDYSAISQLAEDALVSRLQDNQSGFVTVTSAMAAAIELELPELDLTTEGDQLHRVQMAPNDYFNSNSGVSPAVFVYVLQTQDQHYIKGKDFSGSISAGIDVFITTSNEDIPVYLQKLSNLYTDAFYHVFGVGVNNSLQDYGLCLGGGLKVSRTRPQKNEGQNWFQAISVAVPLMLS